MKKPKWPASNAETRPTKKLKPNPKNSKKHSDEQVALLGRSYDEFGFTVPILIDERDVIIAGEGRWLMAMAKELPEVPVIVARGWSPAQKRAYLIADNRLSELGALDRDTLRLELADLELAGFNLDLTGFDEFARRNIMLEVQSGENDPSAEWQGMPGFTQGDKTAFRSIPVHFKDAKAVARFAKLIGQKITPNTRFVWFPEIEI